MMRVKSLRSALEDIRAVFSAAGANIPKNDIETILQLLSGHEDEDLDSFLAELRRVVSSDYVDEEVITSYLDKLAEAGSSEPVFSRVIDAMRSDSRVRKQELVLIAQKYFGKRRRLKAKDSIAAIYDGFRAHFNELRYERESRALARRATPV